MKILFLEDHAFFAKEIVEYIQLFINDGKMEVFYANTYKEAVALVEVHGVFDKTILDVQLQNGRNGIEFADNNKDKIGDILFITGCIEPQILDTLKEKKYQYISKQSLLWETLTSFLKNLGKQ